jgi:hypothetical protein
MTKKVSKEYKLKTVFHKPVRRLRTIVYKILISKQASINKRSQKLRRLSRIISTKILQKILKFERGKSRKIIFKLFLVLTSMIYKSQFSAQNFAFTSIKFSSFEDYSKLNSEISEANHFWVKRPWPRPAVFTANKLDGNFKIRKLFRFIETAKEKLRKNL